MLFNHEIQEMIFTYWNSLDCKSLESTTKLNQYLSLRENSYNLALNVLPVLRFAQLHFLSFILRSKCGVSSWQFWCKLIFKWSLTKINLTFYRIWFPQSAIFSIEYFRQASKFFKKPKFLDRFLWKPRLQEMY